MAVLDLSSADASHARYFGGALSVCKAGRHTKQKSVAFVLFHLIPGWPLNVIMCSGLNTTSGQGDLVGFFACYEN
jgi:hypothetical protein